MHGDGCLKSDGFSSVIAWLIPLAKLFEEPLKQLHSVKHDLRNRRVTLRVPQYQVLLCDFSSRISLSKRQITNQFIVFIENSDDFLSLVLDLFIVQVILGASHITKSLGSDLVLIGRFINAVSLRRPIIFWGDCLSEVESLMAD